MCGKCSRSKKDLRNAPDTFFCLHLFCQQRKRSSEWGDMVRLTSAFEWVVRSAALFTLELMFGMVFYSTAMYGAMAGAHLAWPLTGWQFLREWEGEVAIAITVLGAVMGGGAWLVLRYKVVQPAVRWIG